jgi:hypothetical protein
VPPLLVFWSSDPVAPNPSSCWRTAWKRLGPTIILLWKPLSFPDPPDRRIVVAASAAMGVFLRSDISAVPAMPFPPVTFAGNTRCVERFER